MKQEKGKGILIRRLSENEKIPYKLLLLADEAIEAINKYIHDAEIYVYERDRRIIAAYVLKITGAGGIEIKNIAVDTEFQGEGIGTALLQHASDNAAARGYKELLIGTGDHSVKELALYKKNGFREFHIIRNFFNDNYPKPIYENGKQLIDMVMLKKVFK